MQEHRAARRASIAAVTIAAATLTLVAMTAVNGATAEQTSWRPAITVNSLPELPPDEPPDDPPDVPPEPTDPAPTNPPTTAVPDTTVTATTAVPTGTADDQSGADPSTTTSATGDPTTTGPTTSTGATTTTTLPQAGGLTVTPSELDFGAWCDRHNAPRQCDADEHRDRTGGWSPGPAQWPTVVRSQRAQLRRHSSTERNVHDSPLLQPSYHRSRDGRGDNHRRQRNRDGVAHRRR